MFSAELHLVSYFSVGIKLLWKIAEKSEKGVLREISHRAMRARGGAIPGAGVGPTHGWALGRGQGPPLPLERHLSPSSGIYAPPDLKVTPPRPLFSETSWSSAATSKPKFGDQNHYSGTLPEWRSSPSSPPTPLHQPSMIPPSMCEYCLL